jgi:hypothetical protein
MKSSAQRNLPIVVLAIVGTIILLRDRPAESRTPAPMGLGSSNKKSTEHLPSAKVIQRKVQLSHAPTSEPPMVLIHSTLRRLRELAADEEVDQPDMLQDLLAVLTDANVSVIAQSLSAEELNSPWGMTALKRWLNIDSMKAAEWLATRPDATEEQAWLVADILLETSPRLKNYCERLPDTKWKQNVLVAAGLKVMSGDPLRAISLAQEINPGIARTNLLQSVAYAWMLSDLRASQSWIANVEDPVLREQLQAAGAKAIAVTDPDLAAEWLVSITKSEEVFGRTLSYVVENWAVQDPAMAAGWVARLPAGEARASALEIITRHWMESNPDAAILWIQGLPESGRILANLNIN